MGNNIKHKQHQKHYNFVLHPTSTTSGMLVMLDSDEMQDTFD